MLILCIKEPIYGVHQFQVDEMKRQIPLYRQNTLVLLDFLNIEHWSVKKPSPCKEQLKKIPTGKERAQPVRSLNLWSFTGKWKPQFIQCMVKHLTKKPCRNNNIICYMWEMDNLWCDRFLRSPVSSASRFTDRRSTRPPSFLRISCPLIIKPAVHNSFLWPNSVL